MKKSTLFVLATAALIFLQACAHDEPVVRTTTTEETTIQRPNTTTTETHVRTY